MFGVVGRHVTMPRGRDAELALHPVERDGDGDALGVLDGLLQGFPGEDALQVQVHGLPGVDAEVSNPVLAVDLTDGTHDEGELRAERFGRDLHHRGRLEAEAVEGPSRVGVLLAHGVEEGHRAAVVGPVGPDAAGRDGGNGGALHEILQVEGVLLGTNNHAIYFVKSPVFIAKSALCIC